jgi:hypothetical protein
MSRFPLDRAHFLNTFLLIFDLALYPNANDAYWDLLELKKLNKFCTVSKNLDMLAEIFEASDITMFQL